MAARTGFNMEPTVRRTAPQECKAVEMLAAAGFGNTHGDEHAAEYWSAVDSAVQEPPRQLVFDIESVQPEESRGQLSDEGTEDSEEVQYQPQYKDALDWSVVERSVRLAFDIWNGQPELIWAKKAFDILAAAGLCRRDRRLQPSNCGFPSPGARRHLSRLL